MSPPDTNLKKQESRHKWPLIGMAIVVIFGIGIIVFWTGEEVVDHQDLEAFASGFFVVCLGRAGGPSCTGNKGIGADICGIL